MIEQTVQLCRCPKRHIHIDAVDNSQTSTFTLVIERECCLHRVGFRGQPFVHGNGRPAGGGWRGQAKGALRVNGPIQRAARLLHGRRRAGKEYGDGPRASYGVAADGQRGALTICA